MANIELKRTFPGIAPDRIFQAAASALPQAGFEIWKTRPVGYLLIANRQTPEGKIQAAISIRPGAGGDVTLAIAGEHASEEELMTSGEAFMRIFEDHLA